MRAPFGPERVGMAVTCALLATLLVAHSPVLATQPAGAADAPPIVVFAEYEHCADRAPLSADAAFALQDIRSDPAASDIRIGRSAPGALAAALDARVLSVVVPASAGTPETVLAFTGVDVGHNDENLVSLYAQDEATDSAVALVVQGADVLGSIRRGDETWKVHPLGGGLTAVYRYDTSQLRRHPPNWFEFMRKNELRQRQPRSGEARG